MQCSTENRSQSWQIAATGGDSFGRHSKASITAMDGRCLTPSDGSGPVIQACGGERWQLDRGVHTLTCILAKKNASALAVNTLLKNGSRGDYRSLQYDEYAPEGLAFGNNYTREFIEQQLQSPAAIPHADAGGEQRAAQMWSWDPGRRGRINSGCSNNDFSPGAATVYDGKAAKGRLCLSIHMNEALQVWGGPLADNRHVVLLLNRLEQPASITALWQHLGLLPAKVMKVRDVMNHTDVGEASGGLTRVVGSHDVAVFVLSPA